MAQDDRCIPNIKNINEGDNISNFVDKVNFNFDQILQCGGGPQGEKGEKGDRGIPGATGPQGPQGESGEDGLTWFYFDKDQNPSTTTFPTIKDDDFVINKGAKIYQYDKSNDTYALLVDLASVVAGANQFFEKALVSGSKVDNAVFLNTYTDNNNSLFRQLILGEDTFRGNIANQLNSSFNTRFRSHLSDRDNQEFLNFTIAEDNGNYIGELLRVQSRAQDNPYSGTPSGNTTIQNDIEFVFHQNLNFSIVDITEPGGLSLTDPNGKHLFHTGISSGNYKPPQDSSLTNNPSNPPSALKDSSFLFLAGSSNNTYDIDVTSYDKLNYEGFGYFVNNVGSPTTIKDLTNYFYANLGDSGLFDVWSNFGRMYFQQDSNYDNVLDVTTDFIRFNGAVQVKSEDSNATYFSIEDSQASKLLFEVNDYNFSNSPNTKRIFSDESLVNSKTTGSSKERPLFYKENTNLLSSGQGFFEFGKIGLNNSDHVEKTLTEEIGIKNVSKDISGEFWGFPSDKFNPAATFPKTVTVSFNTLKNNGTIVKPFEKTQLYFLDENGSIYDTYDPQAAPNTLSNRVDGYPLNPPTGTEIPFDKDAFLLADIGLHRRQNSSNPPNVYFEKADGINVYFIKTYLLINIENPVSKIQVSLDNILNDGNNTPLSCSRFDLSGIVFFSRSGSINYWESLKALNILEGYDIEIANTEKLAGSGALYLASPAWSQFSNINVDRDQFTFPRLEFEDFTAPAQAQKFYGSNARVYRDPVLTQLANQSNTDYIENDYYRAENPIFSNELSSGTVYHIAETAYMGLTFVNSLPVGLFVGLSGGYPNFNLKYLTGATAYDLSSGNTTPISNLPD
jgi:hypothetical protein